jgi:hypothetical protein
VIPDEEDPTPVDFTWFRFIGRTRLGLTDREIGRLTITTFFRLYKHYKDTWSLEMRLARANLTYEEAEARAARSQEWL